MIFSTSYAMQGNKSSFKFSHFSYEVIAETILYNLLFLYLYLYLIFLTYLLIWRLSN